MSRSRDNRKKERRQAANVKQIELKVEEAKAVLDRIKPTVAAGDHSMLQAMVDTIAFITRELQSKTTSLERLRAMLFGTKTEKTSRVFREKQNKDKGASTDAQDDTEGTQEGERETRARPGHGRNSAAAYTGAEKVKVPHDSLHSGTSCPCCIKGKVYDFSGPATLVRIVAMAPLSATVFECERLRCNLCGEVFTAPSPEGVGNAKYDETVPPMIGMLKYGAGLPFNRIEKFQEGMGIPMPASTQWELVQEAGQQLVPVHAELIRQAAQGELLHNDDTTMKVLELTREQRAAAATDNDTDERTGVFTSGIVSVDGDKRIALFFTGVKHAGENLADVLDKREHGLRKPIQMCDGLSRNTSGEFKTIIGNCLVHSRRKYVEVAEAFPEECRVVIDTLRDVYKNDDHARQNDMSGEERLLYHQENSGPLMEKLQRWMTEQFAERKVEPNSGLGEAIKYMQKHWPELTLFLLMPGAALDNNVCERALKKAILHRKNAYFYKTMNGARTGDVFMSLIHTAELNGVEPYPYLVALLRHREQVEAAPDEWLPWNFRDTMKRHDQPASAA